MSKTQKWDAERTATLTSIVGETTPVTTDLVAQAAETLEVSTRSISSKLRNMDYEVESANANATKAYTEDEEAELEAFLNANPATYTYAEVAAKVLGGSRSAKQIQGKILSMELYSLVKASPKVERAKTFTEAEEVKLESLVLAGGFIEDIAEAMNREVNQIRGKILSMSRVNPSITIPKQKSYATKSVDAFEALGDVSEMTVAEIAAKIEKTERGVRTILTHRGVDCSDWAGAKRHEKIAEAKASA